MTAQVHQILVGAAPGDAITSMATRLREAFRRTCHSEIYARFIDPALAGDVGPIDHLPPLGPNDRLVYHSSFGDDEVTRTLLASRAPIVLVYHNITPASFYAEVDPGFAAGLSLGRSELRAIRERVLRAVAVSTFNARELTEAGYPDVRVIPVGLDAAHLTRVGADIAFSDTLGERFPHGYVMALSQLLPHKRFETVVQAMHLVQWIHELRQGLLIVGANRQPRYQQALHRHAVQLNVRGVWFAGALPEEQLAAAFAGASAFVSTSAHEGLSLPPLEAMSFGVPVVVRAAGAVRETVGDGAIVLPEGAGPALVAEALAEVLRNEVLRDEVIRRGRRRVDELASRDPIGEFVALMHEAA